MWALVQPCLSVCAAYDECCWLDKALAGVVLTKQNIADHFGIVVNNCKMGLPAVFLDMAQFVDVHQEFAVRTRLVQARKDELGKDTQREIVGKACGPHTSADEVKHR